MSETDTETVAKLLDYYYVDDPVDTIIKVLSEIKGSYALGIMFRDFRILYLLSAKSVR